MKKKLVPTIIALVVLVALVVAYFIVDKKFSENEEANTDDIFGEFQYLWEENAEAISEAVFHIENGAYAIKVGDDITLEGFESVIISRYELLQALRKMSILPVERVVEVEKSQYKKYGFENSKNVITLKFFDGRVRTLVIGHNTGVNNEVYALNKEEGIVATLKADTAKEILAGPSKYRSKVICTLSNSFLRELTVTKGGKKLMAITENDHNNDYIMQHPYSGAIVSQRKISEFLSMFNQIDAEEVVDENPQNISKYGFDNCLEVYVHDSANKHTFKFGDMAPEGGMYIMYGNRPVVYRGNVFLYEMFKEVEPVDYLEPYVHLYDVADVSSFEISKDGKKCSVSVSEKSGKMVYAVNEKNIGESEFSALYQAIAGLYYGTVTDEGVSSDVYAEVVFRMKDGKVNTFKYGNTSKDYCVVRTTNGYNAIVLKSIIDAVWQVVLPYAK